MYKQISRLHSDTKSISDVGKCWEMLGNVGRATSCVCLLVDTNNCSYILALIIKEASGVNLLL